MPTAAKALKRITLVRENLSLINAAGENKNIKGNKIMALIKAVKMTKVSPSKLFNNTF